MNKLNEALFSGFSDNDDLEVDAVADPTYVKAVKDRKNIKKELEKRFKEQDKNVDAFIKDNHKTDRKPKGTKDMKKMKLSEALFESVITESDDIKEVVKNCVDSKVDYVLDNLSQVIMSEVDGYDAEWCDSDGQTAVSNRLAQNKDSFVNSVVEVLFANREGLSEHLESDGEDGWGSEIEQVLSEFFNEANAIQYEVENCRRGSYAINGTKVSDLIYSLNNLSDMLSDIISNIDNQEETLQEDANSNSYQLTYYLNTACAERRPTTYDDIENDYIEDEFEASSDYDALIKALCIAKDDDDPEYYGEEYPTEESVLDELESQDWGDGSTIILKLSKNDKVIYDSGASKEDFLDESLKSSKKQQKKRVKEALEEVDRIYYKTKREPLADIIQQELTSGEIVYRLNDNGKLVMTWAPSLNLDELDIGAKYDDKGSYIIAWVASEAETKSVENIAKKYNKEFVSGNSKYATGDKKFFTKIYIDDIDWEEPYFDPNVKTRADYKKPAA